MNQPQNPRLRKDERNIHERKTRNQSNFLASPNNTMNQFVFLLLQISHEWAHWKTINAFPPPPKFAFYMICQRNKNHHARLEFHSKKKKNTYQKAANQAFPFPLTIRFTAWYIFLVNRALSRSAEIYSLRSYKHTNRSIDEKSHCLKLGIIISNNKPSGPSCERPARGNFLGVSKQDNPRNDEQESIAYDMVRCSP